MHHRTDRIQAFVTPVVEHWLEREIAMNKGGRAKYYGSQLVGSRCSQCSVPDEPTTVARAVLAVGRHTQDTPCCQQDHRPQWRGGYVIGQWAGRYWVRISVPAPTKSGVLKALGSYLGFKGSGFVSRYRLQQRAGF